MKALLITALIIPISVSIFFSQPRVSEAQTAQATITSQEKHLKNIKQLTFDGENAEAYFSFDGKRLIFQRAPKADGCDQIYSMKIDGTDLKMLSNGDGKTTCAFYTPDKRHIIYASTHKFASQCPPKPDYSKGYVWSLFKGFDIFQADLDGKNAKPLTTTSRYDAEATIRKDGMIVFTSLRDGDLDIYTMDKNGRNVKKLTNELGYDGGPFWSADGKQIVYRAYHPETEKEKADYISLLTEDLIRPTQLDLWVMNADGSGKRRITNFKKASFAPFFFPNGKRIIFSSNMDDPKGRNFDLYAVNTDGSGIERITYNDTFDGFPMFTPDGKKLVFASNRNGAKQGDTNIFIADWQP